ncbi:hypothetical protein [Chromobacterium violaceum]|uniref:hypothetical protein n=1 Tax=Chromobacterium violaceum TaxID=536 RepID=UPI001124E747|nr:hypothetical protein [Chromobacterium violaceum]
MEVSQEIHRDKYALVVVSIGPNFPKVFSAVKLITGKSTIEVAKLLKSDRPVILEASKRELLVKAAELDRLGVGFKLVLI